MCLNIVFILVSALLFQDSQLLSVLDHFYGRFLVSLVSFLYFLKILVSVLPSTIISLLILLILNCVTESVPSYFHLSYFFNCHIGFLVFRSLPELLILVFFLLLIHVQQLHYLDPLWICFYCLFFLLVSNHGIISSRMSGYFSLYPEHFI